MAKPNITTRATKGSALTWTEGDANLTNLRDATITVKAGTGGTDVVSDLNGTVTLVAGTNVSISGDNTAKTVTINSTASGGLTVSDDTTTNATRYLVFEDITSGTATTMNVSSTKLTYNPSTGTLSTTILSGATLNGYKETVYALTYGATITPNWNNGTVQKVTLTGAATFAAPTNMVAGSSLTLIIVQDATGSRVGTWNASYKFAGGTPALSTTANAVDIVNVFYDGSLYLTSISKQDSSSIITGLQINAAGELRLADSDSSNYVGFKSPATVSTNKVWTLPASDGTSGQVLSTNGSGALSWATAGGAGNSIIVLHSGQEYINLGTSGQTESWTLVSTGGISGVSVSTDTFTLPAGTYMFQMPFVTSDGSTYADWKLQNTTDSTEVARFTSNSISLSGVTKGFYWQPTTVFTIAASKTFRLQTTSGVVKLVMGATVNGRMTIALIKTA